MRRRARGIPSADCGRPLVGGTLRLGASQSLRPDTFICPALLMYRSAPSSWGGWLLAGRREFSLAAAPDRWAC